jgi:hypothetical protein
MSVTATARRLFSRVADDVALSFDALAHPFRGLTRLEGPRLAP